MIEYEHGILSSEKATKIETPIVVESAVAAIFGTAPIHLASDPYSVTNTPVLIHDMEDAQEKLGYSEDFATYTLCQSMYMRLKKYKVGPVVFVNVLDPNVHRETIEETELQIEDRKVLLKVQGVLLDTICIKSEDGGTIYTPKQDYVASFDIDGTVIVSLPSDSAITGATAKIGYTKLRPDKVTYKDVIGGYDAETRKRTGISCVSYIYNRTQCVPSHLLAPGWSQNPVVAAVLAQSAANISDLFRAIAVIDIDSAQVKDINDLEIYKTEHGLDDEYSLLCYPMVLVGGKRLSMSAVEDVAIALRDEQYDGPYVSPSNQNIDIDGLCLSDGEIIEYDMREANKINGQGIATMFCMGTWRTWGNEMGCYPRNSDVKDRYINVRRIFNYRDVVFKITFFDKVDDLTNKNQIDNIVNEENKALTTLATEGKIAGGSMSFNAAENPMENVLNGDITFERTLSPFTPMKVIKTVTSFDPTLNMKALGIGGE